MIFSYEKKNTLLKHKERGLSTFLLGLFIAAAFFVPFIIYGKGYFIFYGDFNVQQIPFYQLCHQAIRSGEFGWNWLTDLGSDFITSYSFYLLGSPFFWLTLPFPNHIVPYLMGPLLILKFACASLTAYFYIRRFTRSPFSAQIGALLYAFSGFSIYNIFFNHFHEAIILLPLLLLSFELLVTENKRGVFAVTVALCALSNYFFFFGMVVFTLIYYVVRIVSGAIKFKFSRLIAIAIEAVFGVCLAAFLLLPSIVSLLSNSRLSEFLMGWSGILYGKEQIYLNIIECFFFPPDLPARPVFFPNANVKWSSLGGWLPLFSMTAVLGFCHSRKKHWLKRIICVSAFMAFVPILNSAFYAFNKAYYARWFYMPILMMALATAITIEEKEINWKYGFRWSVFITAVIALTVGLFPQKKDGKLVFGLYTDAGESNKYLYRFLIAVGFAVLSLLLCHFIMTLRKKSKVLFRRATIAFLCLITVAYSAVFVLQGTSHSYDPKTIMTDSLIEGSVSLPDDDNYRIDTYSCVDNTAMYLDYSSINAFHSVVSPSIMEYYDFIGITRDVASRPDKEYYSIRNLLSVKYLLNRESGDSFVLEGGKTQMPDYKYLKTENGYYIYENENYIPYGFSYEYYITRSECEKMYSDLARADVMLKAIVLEDEDAEKFSLNMKSYVEYYNELNRRESELLTEQEETETEESTAEQQASQLESSAATESQEEAVTKPVLSLAMDEETLREDSARLKETSAISFNKDSKGFSATVSRKEESLVFFSVPYADGFTATVNGEEALIIKANVGFMAVVVPEGVSDIRFNYTTPFLKEGIMLSLVTLVAFIIYLIIAVSVIKGKKSGEVYPEGEQLLEHWYKKDFKEQYDVIDAIPETSLLDEIPEKREIYIPPNAVKYDSFNIDLSAFNKNVDNDEDE
ncbi:MAG: YfhO family protein [Acutalibacteraceae bacterium]|nr:YfhO family protein [Acutalibacteraceae bacterium]